jgi:hypothetical protein
MIEWWLFIFISGASVHDNIQAFGPTFEPASCEAAAKQIAISFHYDARCKAIYPKGTSPAAIDGGAVKNGLVPKQWVAAGHTASEFAQALDDIATEVRGDAAKIRNRGGQ